MKIVNRKQFLSLPDGIIYSQYESLGMIKGLYQKHKSYSNDWIYQDLLGNVDAEDSGEFADIMFNAEQGGKFTIDLDCVERDGGFEESNMFVIYDKEDLNKLVVHLSETLINYPEMKEGH